MKIWWHSVCAITSEDEPVDIIAQWRFRSDCEFVQANQNLHWALLDGQNYNVSPRGQWRLWSDCADAQADLSLRWAHISEGTFYHVTTHLFCTLITKTFLFKYTENFTTKKCKFSDKISWYFSYFCSKQRLWVLVRTASTRRFYLTPRRGGSYEYLQSLFWAEIRKNNVYPYKSQFYYIKRGFKRVKIISRYVFVMFFCPITCMTI